MKPTDTVLRRLGVSFVAEEKGISEYRLDANSLKILLAPDPAARAVVVVQQVNVGPRHEGAGTTGYCHLLEHMLFMGTPSHNQSLGNSYDDFMKRLGRDCNAFTTHDHTYYQAKLPAHALGEYLEHEADRLRNAIITDAGLATEMPVVLDEFDIGENNPDELLDNLLRATMYTEHQYRNSVIGSRSDVMNVTAEALRDRLYNVYYWPNNVSLVIVGGFDTEQALQHVVRCYGRIPASPKPIPAPYTVEPRQCGERRFVINKPGDLPRVAVAFHIPQADHVDIYALQALSVILGGTPSSRLFRKLVDRGLASSAFSAAGAMRDPGMLKLYASLISGTGPGAVERVIIDEIERLKSTLVSKSELALVKKFNASYTVHLRTDKLDWAEYISDCEAKANWRWGLAYDANFAAVTREQIQDVAQRYLVADNRVVGYFLPAVGTKAGEVKEEHPAAVAMADAHVEDVALVEGEGITQATAGTKANTRVADTADVEVSVSPAVSSAAAAKLNSSSSGYACQVRTTVLPNGLTVMLMPTTVESAIGLSLVFNAGTSRAGAGKSSLAPVVAEMLTCGSARYSKERVGELVSGMLVNFGFEVSAFSSSLHTHVPPDDLPRFLDLLSDALWRPKFDEEELELVKTQKLTDLEEYAVDPHERAMAALSQALYAPANPHYIADIKKRRKMISSIGTDDVRAFHADAYGAEGAVLALVGKFEPAQMLKLVSSKFGRLSSGKPKLQPPDPAIAPAGTRRINIHIEGKDNLTILVGRPIDVSVDAPDLSAAFIANQTLGGNPISARLGQEIRVKRGLTYGIYSYFGDTTFAGGPWLIEMTTSAGKLEQAIALITQVVSEFVSKGIDEDELALEKSSFINRRDLSLDSPLEIASALAQYQHRGLKIEDLDNVNARVAALTKEQVDAAIRKHFLLENAVTVVAGTLR